MLEPEEARAGNLGGNQVHEQALEAARLAGGADMILNVTLDEERRVTGVFAGALEAAHEAAVANAEAQCKVTIDGPVDIVVTTAAGYPLDLTFYQGVKGMVGALPIVKLGGTIIIAQENAEGIGSPEYTEMMLGIGDPHEFMRRALCGLESGIDLWQLHEHEKVLRCCEVLNVSGGLAAEVQERLFVTPVGTVEEAVERALARHGREARIVVIPEGPYVLAGVV
jgi:nickel-dependent lactate racemase